MKRELQGKKRNIHVIVFLLSILIAPLLNESRVETDFLCMLSFVFNGLLFVWGIYRASRKHSVSMELLYWLFMLFFMYFAPVIQYRLDTFPWHTSLIESEILYANLIILIFNIIFLLSMIWTHKIRFVGIARLDYKQWLCSGLEFGRLSKFVMSITVCMLAAYSLSQTGWSGIFVSRAQAVQVFYSGTNSAVELIVESVIPAFMAYVVAEAAQNMVDKKEYGFRFVLLFLCMLVSFFPTAIPRYKAATMYGVIMLVLFPMINKGTKFLWLFTAGMFILFPAMNAIRNVISYESIEEMFRYGFFESYTDGNYDAYRMLVSAIRYNKQYGCTWGYQLLGVIFFFVPSAIWSSKPIGSGAMLIRHELGSSVFSNVSCPFVAEGYVNFGLVGVILFALILGIIVSKLDKKYWDNFEEGNARSLFSPYLFLIFMLFFVMRGDLLSGFAYICGFIATGWMLRAFARTE